MLLLALAIFAAQISAIGAAANPPAPVQTAAANTVRRLPENVFMIKTHSAAMDIYIPAVVILPASYSKSDARYPTVYLLHGHGGNAFSWFGIRPDLQKLASLYNIIIVCPDGAVSWYWDSPKKPEQKYETYVSKELVSQIDSQYRTIASPSGRAITGLSMGGHGGLWLGLRHKDTFGACGSTSGGVDIRPFPKNWHIKDALGDYSSNGEIWDSHTVMTLVDNLKPDAQAIIIDCGTEDFFFGVNEKLHRALLDKKIPHDYLTRPGAHNSKYWKNSIQYQLLFFDNFFKAAAASKN